MFRPLGFSGEKPRPVLEPRISDKPKKMLGKKGREIQRCGQCIEASWDFCCHRHPHGSSAGRFACFGSALGFAAASTAKPFDAWCIDRTCLARTAARAHLLLLVEASELARA
jgi:hypothetical protein